MDRETVKNFFDSYFPSVKPKGGEYNFPSFLFQDKKKRMYVNENDGRWYDQHEQRGGDFISFVSEYLGVSYSEASHIIESDFTGANVEGKVDILDILFGSGETQFDDDIKVKDPLDVEPIMFDEVESLDDDGEEAIRYLQNRKINPSGLGYFPKSDKEYGGRIFVPFYENGELVYFLARSYTGSELRYKNPAGINSGAVFNYDKIDDCVAIFEGSFDAMSVDNIVGTAILSNKMKEEQARKIMQIETLSKIIFVPDCDVEKETRKTILINLLYNYRLLNKYKLPSRKVDFFIYELPDGYKDFGEYKQKTGNGNINIDECVRFSENYIRIKAMLL